MIIGYKPTLVIYDKSTSRTKRLSVFIFYDNLEYISCEVITVWCPLSDKNLFVFVMFFFPLGINPFFISGW